MKNLKIIFLVHLICSSCLLTIAQQGDTLEIQRNEKGHVSYARFQPKANRKVVDGVKLLKAVLKANPDDDLRLTKNTVDDLGISHRVYKQYYKGVRVEDAEYLIHGKNEIIETINGDFQKVNISSIVPSITVQQALNSALNYVHAQKYKWEDANLENFAKKNTKNPRATYYPTGELVITKDFLKGGNNLRLAWKFTISSLIPDNEQLIYVDAATSEIIRDTPLIYDVNTACTAETRYSGILGITGDSFVGGFRLRESRNSVDVNTLNLQNTFNTGIAIDFTNTNPNFTNGSWPNFIQDQPALDAHWGAENVLDYYRIVHNRNSINGLGMTILSYVHAGTNWNNAQWVGGTNNNFMRYGDGDGFTFRPLTSLDICAHEIGHGIAEFTSALTPGTQESGALNEGFSDIWGACVERWVAPTKQTWLLAEDIILLPGFNCLRDMQNPNSTTAAEGQHPDTYRGTFWDNAGEPHTNSTVLSHWFYLITEGRDGINDLGNSYSVTGIGINDAQRIAFRGQVQYLFPSAGYLDARNATISAARDLFGVGSCQEIAVTNAWHAVGIGASYPKHVTNATINGSNPLCSSSTYTITGLPTGYTIAWSTSDPAIATVPANSTGTSVVVTRVSNGNFFLIASHTSTSVACNNYIQPTTKPITSGPYPNYSVQVTGPYMVPLNYTNSWYVDLNKYPGLSNFVWSWPAGWTCITGCYNNSSYIVLRSPSTASTGNINLSFSSCGTNGILATKWVAWGYGGPTYTISPNANNIPIEQVDGTTKGTPTYMISPNPANNILKIEQVDGTTRKPLPQTSIEKVEIIDKMGRVAFRQNYSKGTPNGMTVQVGILTNGVYAVRIFDGKEWKSNKIIIQH